jgi:hypothetical protein
MIMSKNHNGQKSIWQQVSAEEPFIWTQYLQSDLTNQNSSHRVVGVGGGGQVKLDINCVGGWGCGKGGREQKVIPGLLGLQVKARPFKPGIRQGFQFFCVWGDYIKPGSIPSDTLKTIYNNFTFRSAL